MKSIAGIKRCIKRKNRCVPSLLLWEPEWSRIGFQSCYYWSRWAIIYFCPTASFSAHYARGSRLLGHSRRRSPSSPLTLTSSFRPRSQMKGWRLLVPSLFFTPPPRSLMIPVKVRFSAWQKATRRQYVTGCDTGTSDNVSDCLVPSPFDIHYTAQSLAGQWGQKLIYF